MMKTILTFLTAIVLVSTAHGQTSADTFFTIMYRPSFHNPSWLTVYKDKGGNKGLFQTVSVVDGKPEIDTAFATLPDEIYEAYATFFSAYRFPGYIDNKTPDTTSNYEQGLDGITVVGAY